MREIRFRGLGKNGVWRYGYVFTVNEAIQTYVYIRENSSDHRIYKPETVGQWTGLKDKHGKDIYDGDLLRYPGHPENFTAYEVFFHDGDANSSYDIGYCIARTHFQGNIAGGLIPSFKPKTTAQMEVIGNIFEHSHLL